MTKKKEFDISQDIQIKQCLKCNKEFESTGKGNRICPKCNYKNTQYGHNSSRPTHRTSNIEPEE